MKKAILVFLLLIISLSVLAAQETFNRGNFSYKVIEESITITKYTGNDASVQIPASIDGLSVTAIGDRAFYLCYILTRVTIPSSVTTIGDWAFAGCNNLTSVTIPSSVTTIGDGTFSSCTSLIYITVDKRNSAYMSIAGVLFDKSGKTLVCYPAGERGPYTIPSSVTTIGKAAFFWCRSLESVTIPSSVTTIGEAAFFWCRSLGSVTIPSSVITIGDGAFYSCKNLASVTIPSSVTTIGNYAFYWCLNLTSVILSRRTNVEKNTFDDWVLIQYRD